MKKMGYVAALSMCMGSSALAVWGLKYEVNSGSGWTTATTVDVSAGPVTVDFRISVYHDGATVVSGGKTAWAPYRLCNSQKLTNFSTSFGDSLSSFTCSLSSFNPKALVHSESASNLILGSPNDVLSFSSNLAYLLVNPRAQQLSLQYYSGRVVLGNSGSGAQSRTMTLTANSFSFPGATGIAGGGPFGAIFMTSATTSEYGAALEPSVTIPAVITVQLPCPADLTGDRLVDDRDFAIYAIAVDLNDCATPSMPAGCPADLDRDGFVNDADFVLFAVAYDQFMCN